MIYKSFFCIRIVKEDKCILQKAKAKSLVYVDEDSATMFSTKEEAESVVSTFDFKEGEYEILEIEALFQKKTQQRIPPPSEAVVSITNPNAEWIFNLNTSAVNVFNFLSLVKLCLGSNKL